MAFSPPVGARVQKIGGSCATVQIETFIGFSWKDFHRFVLKDEIPYAVKDRFVFIDFDAQREMRTVADKDIRSGIDRLMSKNLDKIRCLFKVSAPSRFQ